MNKILVIILIHLTTMSFGLRAYFDYASFYSPEQGPYVETYLTISGNSVVFKQKENGKFQAEIEITLLFKYDEEIKQFKKYSLKSPEADSLEELPNFIDVQRIPLENGDYNFELRISDLNSKDTNTFSHSGKIILDYQKDNPAFSGVEFVENYAKSGDESLLTKSGLKLVPYTINFFPADIDRLAFYAEIYHIDTAVIETSNYLVQYFIEESPSQKPLNEFSRFQRKKSGDVAVIFGEFRIDRLASGNYNLVIQARNSENELIIQTKRFFQRSNPGVTSYLKTASASGDSTFADRITNPDTLAAYIECLYPIADTREQQYISNQLENKNPGHMQRFFFTFWNQRDKENPEHAWNEYHKNVKYVNKEYKTLIKKGYETDRGRVYLQYGKPNSISEGQYEPSAYPYEIWHYYKLEDGQNNKRFVFYNPDIVGNDYALLHSDARGEITNHNWQIMLHLW